MLTAQEGVTVDAVAELRSARIEAETAARELVLACVSPSRTAAGLSSAAEKARWAAGRLWSAAEAVRFLSTHH